MCGRFTLHSTWSEASAIYSIIPIEAAGRNDRPRYNIAPTQDVGFVCEEDGNITAKDGRWWLVPFWAKEISKYPMFNARSETAREKPSFRDAFKTKRCLILADGYYEWTKAKDGNKDPWYITLPDKKPFMFAGLWAHNTHLDITSCTILTAPATFNIEPLHKRMPVILNNTTHKAWLSAETSVDDAHGMLSRNQGEELVFHRVGRDVNSSRVNGSSLIEAKL